MLFWIFLVFPFFLVFLVFPGSASTAKSGKDLRQEKRVRFSNTASTEDVKLVQTSSDRAGETQQGSGDVVPCPRDRELHPCRVDSEASNPIIAEELKLAKNASESLDSEKDEFELLGMVSNEGPSIRGSRRERSVRLTPSPEEVYMSENQNLENRRTHRPGTPEGPPPPIV